MLSLECAIKMNLYFINIVMEYLIAYHQLNCNQASVNHIK